MRKKNKKPLRRRIVLRLPDLDHAKNSVLQSTIASGLAVTQAQQAESFPLPVVFLI